MGTEISDKDLENIQFLCQQVGLVSGGEAQCQTCFLWWVLGIEHFGVPCRALYLP